MSFLDDALQEAIQQASPLSLRPGQRVVTIRRRLSQPAAIDLESGASIDATCLRCPATPCIRYANDEQPTDLPGLLPDMTSDVCSVRAIHISTDTRQPEIIDNLCIACGVCVDRCPVGAIYFSPDSGTAKIARADATLVDYEEAAPGTSIIELAPGAERAHVIIDAEQPLQDLITSLFARVRAVSRNAQALRPNVLVRNLVRQMGYAAASQRDGVQYNAGDVVGRLSAGRYIIVEVGTRDDNTMDAPRDIAADLAMLVSRHGMHREDLVAATCLLSLPPHRSEYWHVVADFERHYQLQIQTIPLLALILAVWTRISIDLADSRLIDHQRSFVEVWGELLGLELSRIITPETSVAFDRVAQRPSG